MPKGAPRPPHKPSTAAANQPPVDPAGAKAGAAPASAARRSVTPARMPKGSAPPIALRSAASARTTTLDDPMTTSLLAEISRRSRTIEVAPEQIEEATDSAMDGATDGSHAAAPGD